MFLSGVAVAVTPEVHVLGSGSDVSYVVIQDKGLSPTPLIFAYRYNFASNPPITGYGLLAAISAAYPELQIASTQYSFGRSLDAFDFQGATVSSSTAPDGNSGTYWSYYASGGYDGSGVVGSNAWSYSQYGFEGRTITPGSCDGWTFASWEGTNEPSDSPPSVDVAEIASLVAAAAATPTPSPAPTPSPTPDTNPLAINVGQGPDVSFVVIQEPGLSSRPIVLAYRYTNASSPPITGYRLLMAIHEGYPDFDFATTQYSFGKSLDAFRLGGTTVSSSTAPDGNGGYYWSYYLCGGYDGSGTVGANAWSYSQYGFESRTIAPGSCDGWTLASWQGTNGMDVPPTIDPTFLAALSTGSGSVTAVTSSSPTPKPSPKVTPSPVPPATATPTPQGSSGGGAVSGGIVPVGVPQGDPLSSALPATTTEGGASAANSGPPGSGGIRSVLVPEAAPIASGSVQQGYAPPPWFQSSGFTAPVDASSLLPPRPRSPDPAGSLRIMSPFRSENPMLPDGESSASSGPASHPTSLPPHGQIRKGSKNGFPVGLLDRITGHLDRFWKALVRFLNPGT